MNQTAKFAYISLVLQRSRGIETKLSEQAESVERVGTDLDVVWLTTSPSKRDGRFIVQNITGRGKLACRVRQMKVLKSLQARYRGIILRYPLCDPLTFLLLPRLRNVASEHHTKEIAELWVARDPRLVSEISLGRMFLRRFAGFFAVTDEILEYELARAGVRRPGFVTYNAISPQRYQGRIRSAPLMATRRLKFVFASGNFPAWQGLDLVIQAFADKRLDCELHLCGQVSNEQQNYLRSLKSVIVHGSLSPEELLKVYASCDVGIASFGLFRNNLKEATSLKVREYLACGLPVVLGHHDPAFPKGFQYLLEQARFDLVEVLRWCDRMKPVTRDSVFRASESYISIDSLVRRQFQGLENLFGEG